MAQTTQQELKLTCSTCEYYDYRNVKIAALTNGNTGYICAVRGRGTSGDKEACPCYLEEGKKMTKKEKMIELQRVANCRRAVKMRTPRNKDNQ